MTTQEDIYRQHEAEIDRGYRWLVEHGRWLDCPMIVSIETYAKCNASCEFCPYPTIERQGARLPPATVRALIDEIAGFSVPPQRLNFSRVNEPFLDPNLLDYMRHAAERLSATDLVIFSNGQTITDKVIDQLNEIATFRTLNISFNEHDAGRYQEVMGIDQAATLPRLRNLHRRFEEGTVRFNVTLLRVGTSSSADRAFADWCKAEFPAFPVFSSARFDWVDRSTSKMAHTAPDAGCSQWFSLHILADGQSAFCCIDGDGRVQPVRIGDRSLLAIYNQPEKRILRERATSRRQVPGCDGCIHGMPSAAYAVPE